MAHTRTHVLACIRVRVHACAQPCAPCAVQEVASGSTAAILPTDSGPPAPAHVPLRVLQPPLAPSVPEGSTAHPAGPQQEGGAAAGQPGPSPACPLCLSLPGPSPAGGGMQGAVELPAGMRAAAALIATRSCQGMSGGSNGDSGAEGEGGGEGGLSGPGVAKGGRRRGSAAAAGALGSGGSRRDVGCIATAMFRCACMPLPPLLMMRRRLHVAAVGRCAGPPPPRLLVRCCLHAQSIRRARAPAGSRTGRSGCARARG